MFNLLQHARRAWWGRWLFDNPLLMREVRRRMRNRLFSLSLIFYIILLGVITCLIMFASYPMAFEIKDTRELIQQVGGIGQRLFSGMIALEILLAIIVAPLLTSGVATAEKDRNTFDFLRVTTLSANTFVIGCLLTTAGMLLLVMSCTLPILGLTFIFGGISMEQILSIDLVIFCLGMALAAVGVFHSSGPSRSRGVRVITTIALIVLILIVAPAILQWIVIGLFARGGQFAGWQSLTGATWRPALTLSILLLLVMLTFAVGAARRLYEPNNRLFNYKQFTLFFVILMGFLCGLFADRVLSLNTSNPFEPDDVMIHLSIIYFTGLGLVMFALLLLSTGRVERGDELWRLRLRRPLFQRFDERIPLFAFYLILWLAPVAVLARFNDIDGRFTQHMIDSLPIALLILVVVAAMCRLLSLSTPLRNRAAVTTVLLLLILWGVLPAVGFALREISAGLRHQSIPPAQFVEIGNYLLDFTPFRTFYHLWEDHPLANRGRTCLMMAVLAAVALLPTLLPAARARFRVSYDLTPRPPATFTINSENQS